MAIDKAVDSAVLDGYFEDIADAIRNKGGSGTFAPEDMPDAIGNLPAGDPGLEALLAGTASGDVTANVTGLTGAFIKFYSLYDNISKSNENVTILRMPNLVSMAKATPEPNVGGGSGGLVFDGGKSLSIKEIHLPKCKVACIYVGNRSALSLDVVDAPLLENAYISLSNTAITELSLPKLKTAKNASFYGCTQLTSVNLPEVTDRTPSFDGCSSLVHVNMPKVTELIYSAFRNCTALTECRLPSAKPTSNAGNTFNGATALTLIDFGAKSANGASIGSYMFNNCQSLVALVVRNNPMATLAYTNAFTNTPIESGTGYIYVPRALISSYESATNWSTFAGQFRAIEDYTDDGTIDGEFIMPT